MNLRQLEILRSVVRTRSTVAAAQDLGMSQPAVSNAIKSAEISLGFLLFDRVNKRLNPTQEAIILLAEAEPLFLMRDVVNQTAKHLRTGHKGRMRIVATSELSESLLPGVIAKFVQGHEGLHVSLETQRLDNVLEYVETGVADVGFAIEPYPRHTLDYLPLATLDMVCACHVDSPLCDLPFVTPSHLEGESLINARTSSNIGNKIEDVFKRSKAAYSPTIDVRFMNVAGLFVEEKLGVAIIDELTASSQRYRALRSVPFKPRIKVVVNAIVSSSKPQQRLTRTLLDHAREVIRTRLGPSRDADFEA